MATPKSTRLLAKLVRAYGGFAPLARAIGVTPWAVQKWHRRGIVPAERVLTLVALSGGTIRPHQLRPDLYPVELVGGTQ